MKTGLLKKVRSGIFAQKSEVFGVSGFELVSEIGTSIQNSGFFCTSPNDMIKIVEGARLAAARELKPTKRKPIQESKRVEFYKDGDNVLVRKI